MKRFRPKVLALAGFAAAFSISLCGCSVSNVSVGPWPINNQTFPDKIFREYVASYFDANGDETLSREEAEAVEYIGKWDEEHRTYVEPLSNSGVTSFEGIGCFANLKGFVANGNIVTALDVSQNKKLEYVVLGDSALEQIDVSGCSSIQDVWVNPDAKVIGLPGDFHSAHLLTSGRYNLAGTSDNILKFVYSPDGKLMESASGRDDYAERTYYEYDSDNKLTKSHYGPSSDCYTTYEYDDQQRLVSKKEYGDGEISSSETLAYDDQGRVSEMTSTHSGYHSDFVYLYDDKSRLTRVKCSEGEGPRTDVAGLFTFEYDNAGNMISCNAKTTQGIGIEYREAYTYDSKGRMTSEKTWYDESGDPSNSFDIEYSDDGTICQVGVGNGGCYEKIEFDESGRITSIIEPSGEDEIDARKVFSYTEKGLLVESTEELDPDSSYPTTSTYRFSPIAHYGKTMAANTVDFQDFFPKPFEPEGGAYLPVADKFASQYVSRAIGVNLPYPANLNFYLSPS